MGWDRTFALFQVTKAMCERSSLFQSMVEVIQPMCVITVMETLPLLLRWVGHLEASFRWGLWRSEARSGHNVLRAIVCTVEMNSIVTDHERFCSILDIGWKSPTSSFSI